MQQNEAENLLAKLQAGLCNDEEKALIEKWLSTTDLTKINLSADDLKEDFSAMAEGLPLHHRTRQTTPFKSYLSAAAAIALVFGGMYWYNIKYARKESPSAVVLAKQQPAILPGSDKATITLSNGKTVDLTTLNTGKTNLEEGIEITKTADNQLVYAITSPPMAGVKQYNSIQTPKGGQFQVLLPDGTHVWLNAATKLTYPVAFTASERKVELEGEAYFDVTADKNKPFKVITRGKGGRDQEIRVLGTHFNIQAYADEPATKTTLLEGSVKVSNLNTQETKTLIPGVQAILKENASAFVLKKISKREVLGWKNGNFVFDDESLPVIMRQISRWYDVDIQYENIDSKGKFFGGTISRKKNIAQVLDILELTGSVHFKTIGRSVIVMP